MQISSLPSGLPPLLPTTTQVDARGLTLGKYSQGGAAGNVTVTATTVASDTAETFSAEIMRRLQSAQTASNAGTLAASGAAGDLEKALADSIEYVREKHGDAAATAVMGIVVKGVGDGSGGEDALGNALVSSLKFIDRNFGIASGDAAMAQFNGSLNDAVNGYFQNGHNELFHAAESSGGTTDQIQGILASTLSAVSDRFGQDAAKTVSDILTGSLEKTGFTRKGLGTALAAADDYLTEQYGTSDLTAQPGAQTTLAKGTVLNVAV